MSTTPVRITLRANEWCIIADLLDGASLDANEQGRIWTAATASKYADMINNKIKGR